MAGSLEVAFESLRDMVTGAVQRTAQSEALELQARAMDIIEEDEGFSGDDLADAALAITNNTMVANIYVNMKNKTARRKYLLRNMEMLKKD